MSLLEDFGFARHGVKRNAYGDEQVYVRDFAQSFNVADPKLTSVVTTVGIVEGVYKPIAEAHFIRLCRKRSVFTDDELRAQLNYNPNSRPFIVGFLYTYSFPKRPNLKELIDNGDY